MNKPILGIANRILHIAKLLDQHDVNYVFAGGVASNVGDDPRVDILTVAWKVTYDQAASNAIRRKIKGVNVAYLSLKDLIHSKQTGRPQDQADIDVLSKLDRS